MKENKKKDRESKITYNFKIISWKINKKEGYKMVFYIVLLSHSPLMHWKLSGFLIALKSFDRYLTCASVLSIFELKM